MMRALAVITFILLVSTAFAAKADCDTSYSTFQTSSLVDAAGEFRIDGQKAAGNIYFVSGANPGTITVYGTTKPKYTVEAKDGVLTIKAKAIGSSTLSLHVPAAILLALLSLVGQRGPMSAGFVCVLALVAAQAMGAAPPGDDELCTEAYPVVVIVDVPAGLTAVEIVTDDADWEVDVTARADWTKTDTQCDNVACVRVEFPYGACGIDCGLGSIPGVESFTCDTTSKVCTPICRPGFDRCGKTAISDGCVAVSATDCCGTSCLDANTIGATCTAGQCANPECAAGWLACDGEVKCETEVTGSNCGVCGDFKDCTSHAGATAGSTCDTSATPATCIYECAPGKGDCDPAVDGCETDVNLDTQCGGCTTNCNDPLANSDGTSACDQATFTCAYNCAPGYGDCSDAAPGCETQLNTDGNCGACGVTCDSAVNTAGVGTCTATGCSYTCTGSFQSCPGDDGCETSTTDPAACGSCDKSCTDPSLNVADGAQCVAGACVATCASGAADCNGDLADGTDGGDGCETDVTGAGAEGFCGACDVTCDSIPNTKPGSTCGLDTGKYGCTGIECEDGFSNCGADILLGCNIDLTTDVTHCGDCATVCDKATMHVNNAECKDSLCDYDSCSAGFQDCNGVRTDGCETPIDALSNCQACNNAPTSVTDCLAANTHVSSTPTCGANGCVFNCASPFLNCKAEIKTGTPAADFGCETDSSLVANCGTCGNNCDTKLPAAQHVTATTCKLDGANGYKCQASTCEAGWAVCPAGAFDTACTTDITRPVTCGSCTNDCNGPTYLNAAAPACTNQVCDFSNRPVACAAGWYDCDGSPLNGCENAFGQYNGQDVNCRTIALDPLMNVDATKPYCPADKSGGKCAFVCKAGFSDCDGDPLTGCEKPLVAGVSICDSSGPYSAQVGKCETAFDTPLYVPLFYKYFFIVRPPIALDFFYSNDTLAADIPAFAPFDCLIFSDAAFAAKTHVVVNTGSCGNDAADRFPGDPASCSYTCEAGFYDCNKFPQDGCEVSTAVCGAAAAACGPFTTDTNCGWNVCLDCTTLPGSDPTVKASTCKPVLMPTADAIEPDGYCDTTVCQADLCFDENKDWTDGCESAQAYKDRYGIGIACGQIDPVEFHLVDWPFCDGRATIAGQPNFDAGRCVYTCLDGWTDCDLDPRNGCETELDPDSPCGATCNVFSTVSCGAGVCLDCTTLPGSLLSDYSDPVDGDVFASVSASASTCALLSVEEVSSVAADTYVCDTTLHLLNPSYDFPSGSNGACQAELCRDSDGDWKNGCESAQLYGRGPNYNFGNNNRNDVWGVPYIRNQYQDAAAEFNYRFFSLRAFDDYSLAALAPASIQDGPYYVEWQYLLLGYVSIPPEDTLRHEVYANPVDCELSEWSAWGTCTIADDCLPYIDHWLQTRIRTRHVIVQARDGGDCHLPLVEDWFEYASNDVRIGDGLMIRVAIPSHSFVEVENNAGVKVQDWAYFDRALVGDLAAQPYPGVTSKMDDVVGQDDEERDLRLTCAPSRTCTNINQGANVNVPCQLSKWSAWSECSAACDGDYAGGVRIRTRTVLKQAANNQNRFQCFRNEFYKYDVNGIETGPLDPEDIEFWAGQLFQEDWGCNSQSCAEFNCLDLATPAYCGYAADGGKNIDCSPLAQQPVCDGRDWPTTHASDWALSDLFNDEINEDYEFRWPGHCLYDCLPGFIDCDGVPDNGCETASDKCAFGIVKPSTDSMVDAETYHGSGVFKTERLLTFGHGWINRIPNLHPWGRCVYAYEDRLLPADRTEPLLQRCYDDGSDLFENTLERCQPDGECSRTCIKDHGHCGDENNCVSITEPYRCGKKCLDCFALPWGAGPEGVACVRDETGEDYKCVRDCPAGCWDVDGDWENGCEVASYRGFPWPNMAENTELEGWSDWTQCTRADDCGLLIDCTEDADSVYCTLPSTCTPPPSGPTPAPAPAPEFSYSPYNIPASTFISDADCLGYKSVQMFRNVGIQARFRNVCSPATQGGAPMPFHIYKVRPPLEDPAKQNKNIPNLLIDATYYQVKACDNLAECIECTNQLEGLEESCVLSEWSDWGPCSADCNPIATHYAFWNWGRGAGNVDAIRFNDYHLPVQVRTRTVVKSASKGGLCPPKGDKWTWFSNPARGDDAFGGDRLSLPDPGSVGGFTYLDGWISRLDDTYVAAASYLIDARPCNYDVFCDYPLDCDALNDYYPGHFIGFYQYNYESFYKVTEENGFEFPSYNGGDERESEWQMNGDMDNQVTCVNKNYLDNNYAPRNEGDAYDDYFKSGAEKYYDFYLKKGLSKSPYFGQYYTPTGFEESAICDMLCDTLNGYTDCDLDLRDGCEPYVYDHSCGRYDCEFGGLVDCTILPGLIAADAAPCSNEHLVRRWHPKFWHPSSQWTEGAPWNYDSGRWQEYDAQYMNASFTGCIDGDGIDKSKWEGKKCGGPDHSYRHLFYRRIVDNDGMSRGFNAHHQCDLRWACDNDYCVDRDRQWRTGCEEARNYRYPYATYRHALYDLLTDLIDGTGPLKDNDRTTWYILDDYNDWGGEEYTDLYADEPDTYHDFRIIVDATNILKLNNRHTSYDVRWKFDCSRPRCDWGLGGSECHVVEDANGLFFGCVGDMRNTTVSTIGAKAGPFNVAVPSDATKNKWGEGGNCEFVCASNYRDCDLDPRNGCETEVAKNNDGAFVWLGSCNSLASLCDQTTDVHIRKDSSCGAGLCANCASLPGVIPDNQNKINAKCFLVVDYLDKSDNCDENYPDCLKTDTCCRPLQEDTWSTDTNDDGVVDFVTILTDSDAYDFYDAFITYDILYDDNAYYGGLIYEEIPYNFQGIGTDDFFVPLWAHDTVNADLLDVIDGEVDAFTVFNLPDIESSYNVFEPFKVHNHHSIVYECTLNNACGSESRCYDWDDRWDNGCEVALGYYDGISIGYDSNYYGIDWMTLYYNMLYYGVLGYDDGFDDSTYDDPADLFLVEINSVVSSGPLAGLATHGSNHIFENYAEGGYREAAVIIADANGNIKNCNYPPYPPGDTANPHTKTQPIGEGWVPFVGHNFNNANSANGLDQSISMLCPGDSNACDGIRWAENVCEEVDPDIWECEDDDYISLFDQDEYNKWDPIAYNLDNNVQDGLGYCELVQGFDCSFMFSNLRSWVDNVWSPYRHISTGKTFAEQYHIRTDRMVPGSTTWGCDGATGLCLYECIDGWDDCDGDPSNGCEVDLAGPCHDYYFKYWGTRIGDMEFTSPSTTNQCMGTPVACNPAVATHTCDSEGKRVMGCFGLGRTEYACGIRDCYDCTTLSGSYTFPGTAAVAPCNVLPTDVHVLDGDIYSHPKLGYDIIIKDYIGRTKHFCDIRFKHLSGCNTDGSTTTSPYVSTPWCIEHQCDPHLCVDVDGVFNNGCEVAVNYPVTWFGRQFWDVSVAGYLLDDIYDTPLDSEGWFGTVAIDDLEERDSHADFCDGCSSDSCQSCSEGYCDCGSSGGQWSSAYRSLGHDSQEILAPNPFTTTDETVQLLPPYQFRVDLVTFENYYMRVNNPWSPTDGGFNQLQVDAPYGDGINWDHEPIWFNDANRPFSAVWNCHLHQIPVWTGSAPWLGITKGKKVPTAMAQKIRGPWFHVDQSVPVKCDGGWKFQILEHKPKTGGGGGYQVSYGNFDIDKCPVEDAFGRRINATIFTNPKTNVQNLGEYGTPALWRDILVYDTLPVTRIDIGGGSFEYWFQWGPFDDASNTTHPSVEVHTTNVNQRDSEGFVLTDVNQQTSSTWGHRYLGVYLTDDLFADDNYEMGVFYQPQGGYCDPFNKIECSNVKIQHLNHGAGTCDFVCENNWADCDGDPTNGCEASLIDDIPVFGTRCGDNVKDFSKAIPTIIPGFEGVRVCRSHQGSSSVPLIPWSSQRYCGVGLCIDCTAISGVHVGNSRPRVDPDTGVPTGDTYSLEPQCINSDSSTASIDTVPPYNIPDDDLDGDWPGFYKCNIDADNCGTGYPFYKVPRTKNIADYRQFMHPAIAYYRAANAHTDYINTIVNGGWTLDVDNVFAATSNVWACYQCPEYIGPQSLIDSLANGVPTASIMVMYGTTAVDPTLTTTGNSATGYPTGTYLWLYGKDGNGRSQTIGGVNYDGLKIFPDSGKQRAIRTCRDADGEYANGCETALGYNINYYCGTYWDVSMPTPGWRTDQCLWDQSVGVIPFYTSQFLAAEILDGDDFGYEVVTDNDGTNPDFTAVNALGAGFNCDVLNLLPIAHTHVKAGQVICRPADGLCDVGAKCISAEWDDCDKNPWNGCETDLAICGSCSKPLGKKISSGAKECVNLDDLERHYPEELRPFCDGGRIPPHFWYNWRYTDVGAGAFTGLMEDFENVDPDESGSDFKSGVNLVYEMFDITTYPFYHGDFTLQISAGVSVVEGGQLEGERDASDHTDIYYQYSQTDYFMPSIADNGLWILDYEDCDGCDHFASRLEDYVDPDVLVDTVSAYTIPGYFDSWNVNVWYADAATYTKLDVDNSYKNYPEMLDVSCRVFQRSEATYGTKWGASRRAAFQGDTFMNDVFFGYENYFSYLWEEILEYWPEAFNGDEIDLDREDSYWPLASGRCAALCDIGFSDCNGDPSDACEAVHTDLTSCGFEECAVCGNLPGLGVKTDSNRKTRCVSTGSAIRGVVPTVFDPFCLTTSSDATAPCNAAQCIDRDFDSTNRDGWKNGCEMPMNYSTLVWAPISVEFPEGVGADPMFDCSWIYDSEQYGWNGKDNFNVKNHINIDELKTGTHKGYCVGEKYTNNVDMWGKCDFICKAPWYDLDGDPSNGCEWNTDLCGADGITAKQYAEYPGGLNCALLSGLGTSALGYIEGLEPWCSGLEGGDGLCHGYACDSYEGYCDSGMNLLDGCKMEDGSDSSNMYCGFDWAHHELDLFPGFDRSVQLGFDLSPIEFNFFGTDYYLRAFDGFYPLKYLEDDYVYDLLRGDDQNSDYANLFSFHLGHKIAGNSFLVDPLYDPIFDETGTFDTYHKFTGVFPDYSYPSTTNKCARCADLDGYKSAAKCVYDPRIAGDFKTETVNLAEDVDFYKPWHFALNLDGRFVLPMSVTGNTFGDYYCQVAGAYDSGSDGQCNHHYCVDEDSFWANGCETAIGYDEYSGYFDYHFIAPDWNWYDYFGKAEFYWNDQGDVDHPSWLTPFGYPPILDEFDAPVGEVWDYWSNGDWNRGVWCPYLQFWSIATDNYDDGSCYCQADYNSYWQVRWSTVEDLDESDYYFRLFYEWFDVFENYHGHDLLNYYRDLPSSSFAPLSADFVLGFTFPDDFGSAYEPGSQVFVLFAHRLEELPESSYFLLTVEFDVCGCVEIVANSLSSYGCGCGSPTTTVLIDAWVPAGQLYAEIRFVNLEGGVDSPTITATSYFAPMASATSTPPVFAPPIHGPGNPLLTGKYNPADSCLDYYCPHLHPDTMTEWVTCVNDAAAPNRGKCNFKCNEEFGWKDCDVDPMNGCETQTFDDHTCGSNCQRIDCSTLDGLNPFYDTHCANFDGVAECDLICGSWTHRCDGAEVTIDLCADLDEYGWETGCETALNYEYKGETFSINCREMRDNPDVYLNLAYVWPCNGEPGHEFAGKCQFTCKPGYVDCDGDPRNGCEHDGTLCQDLDAPGNEKCTGALGYDVEEGMTRNYNNLWGNEQYAFGYRAVYDCTQLERTFPDHFTIAPEGISCDADPDSATAGLCIGWQCDNLAGYYDCDGDPRNGCEHMSMHENCGGNGECMNCFILSGTDYHEANPLYILPERLIILSNHPVDIKTADIPYWDGFNFVRNYDYMYGQVELRIPTGGYNPLRWNGVKVATDTNEDGVTPAAGSGIDRLSNRRIDWRLECNGGTCVHTDLANGLEQMREAFSGAPAGLVYPFVKRIAFGDGVFYGDSGSGYFDYNYQNPYADIDPNFYDIEPIDDVWDPTAADGDDFFTNNALKEGSSPDVLFLDSVYDYVSFRAPGGRYKPDMKVPAAATFFNPFDRLGCFFAPITPSLGNTKQQYLCAVITADELNGSVQPSISVYTHCLNRDNSWLTGYERATKYDFDASYGDDFVEFDCSRMGWVFNQPAKITTTMYTPSYHVSQRPQAVGCDYPGSGGPILFDQRRALTQHQSETTLSHQTKDRKLQLNELDGERPGPTQVPGFCYYLCEEHWKDCDGDPRNGCEVDTRKCIDAEGSGPTGWVAHPYNDPQTGYRLVTDGFDGFEWDGCETALGYGRIYVDDNGDFAFNCASLRGDATVVREDTDRGFPMILGAQFQADFPPPSPENDFTTFMFCRPDTGKCDYTCIADRADCDGLPVTPGSGQNQACEQENGHDDLCNCVDCTALPGVPLNTPSSCTLNDDDDSTNDQCDLSVCSPACVDEDTWWKNGCEVATNYTKTIRTDLLVEAGLGSDSSAIKFDCSVFEDPFYATINHVLWNSPIDDQFIRYSSDARPNAYCNGDTGRCTFACAFGYNDCDGIPHNGCEEPNFLCTRSVQVRPLVDTQVFIDMIDTNYNDYCSKSVLTGTNGYDCLLLWQNFDLPQVRVDLAAVIPYCVRDPDADPELFEEKAGYCHFVCQAGYADCDDEPGCEAAVNIDVVSDKHCTENCVDCWTVSGQTYDVGTTHGCLVINGTRQCDLSSCVLCENRDGDWRNGCETATKEIDSGGVFVTRDSFQNCATMQREVHLNPELFNRHLHIELNRSISINQANAGGAQILPAGTIFCNDGLLVNDNSVYTGLKMGTCYFECEDDYFNDNDSGWDGCEVREDGIEFMPEWRRFPTVDFHENNCLYWFAQDSLGPKAPLLFENTNVCAPAPAP